MTFAICAMDRICFLSSCLPVRSRCASSSAAMSKWSTIESLPRATDEDDVAHAGRDRLRDDVLDRGRVHVGSSSFGTAFVAEEARAEASCGDDGLADRPILHGARQSSSETRFAEARARAPPPLRFDVCPSRRHVRDAGRRPSAGRSGLYRSIRSASVLQSMQRSVTGRARSRAADGRPHRCTSERAGVERRALLDLQMSFRSRSRSRSAQFRPSSRSRDRSDPDPCSASTISWTARSPWPTSAASCSSSRADRSARACAWEPPTMRRR